MKILRLMKNYKDMRKEQIKLLIIQALIFQNQKMIIYNKLDNIEKNYLF